MHTYNPPLHTDNQIICQTYYIEHIHKVQSHTVNVSYHPSLNICFLGRESNQYSHALKGLDLLADT